jgi:hypothetical protein
MQKQNKQQENIFISADKVDEPNNIAFDWLLRSIFLQLF